MSRRTLRTWVENDCKDNANQARHCLTKVQNEINSINRDLKSTGMVDPSLVRNIILRASELLRYTAIHQELDFLMQVTKEETDAEETPDA